MSTFQSRGLRGSAFEQLLNMTNEKYLENHLALIQKIPTPITPINMDKGTGHITLAYFDKKSTVDYIGLVQGIPVCFDAKECNTDTFPLANIHEHQFEFMQKWEEQDGVAFILIYYTHREKFYYLTCRELASYWERAKSGGRKSFRYEELNDSYFLPESSEVLVPYLVGLQTDLKNRD